MKLSVKKLFPMLFIMIFFLLSLTSCTKEQKGSSGVDGYKQIEKENATYYYKKGDIKPSEVEKFAEINETAIKTLSEKYGDEEGKKYSIYIEDIENSYIKPNRVIFSANKLKEQNENYSCLTAALMYSNQTTPTWFINGMGYPLGKSYSEWDIIPAKPCKSREYLVNDETGKMFAFADEIYLPENPKYNETIEITSHYINFIAENYGGNETILKIANDFSKFKDITGKTEPEIRVEWAKTLEIPAVLIDDKSAIMISDGAENPNFRPEYPKSIVSENNIYLFNVVETDDETALEFVKKSEQNKIKLIGFLSKSGTNYNREFAPHFALTKKDIENGYEEADDETIKVSCNNQFTELYPTYFIKALLSPVTNHELINGLAGYIKNLENINDFLNDNKDIISSTPQNFSFQKKDIIVPKTDEEKSEIIRATSFVKYLIDETGKENFMKIFMDPMSSQITTFSTIEQHKVNWLNKNGINAKFTPDVPFYTGNQIPKESLPDDKFITNGDKITYTSDNVIIIFEKDYDIDKKEVTANILNSIDGIKSYIGENHIVLEEPIIYNINSGSSNSVATGNEITISYIKEGIAEYAHEAVHALVGPTEPLWISEGFATLIDQKFSKTITTPAGGRNLHELAYQFIFIEGHKDITNFKDENYRYANEENSQNLKTRSYIAAASLLAYVEEEYGKEKLLEYQANEKDIETILNIDFETLKSNWLKYLNEKYTK